MLVRIYGDAPVSQKSVYKWFERFCGGAESTKEQRSGRQSPSATDENVSKINEMIRANRRLTIREISNALNISFGSVQLVLTKNLNMRRVRAEFVPRFLSQEYRELRPSISELRDHANSDSCFLRSLITEDESWDYDYDPETKMQSSDWKTSNSPRAKKARHVDCFLRY
jgi:hypothetical protein